MGLFRRFSIYILFSSLSSTVFCQSVLQSNPISLALSSCDVTLSNEWSSQSNPAGLGNLYRVTAAVLYENRYNLSDLSTKGGSLAFPFKYGTIGSSVLQFGSAEFKTTRISGSYSRQFGKKIAAGLQFNYWSDFISGAGHFGALIVDAGIIYKINHQLNFGLHVFNPEESSIRLPEYNSKIPGNISIGISDKIISSTTLYASIIKSYNYSPDVNFAMETTFAKVASARIGYSLTENQISAGLGIIINSLSFNLGFAHQEPLGNISSVSLAWALSSKKQ